MKCGLEVHQRLDTHKLFCNCESREGIDLGVTINRKLYAVKSELGIKDSAASYEVQKNKDYIYHVHDNCCLVETDSEPPNDLNREALQIVLTISKMLNAKPVDEVHVMRKTVVDGSNTAGFQRTMVISTNGYIETSKGKVLIESICLEEESAGIIKKQNHVAEYRLDRLGIPLIEITTAPDIISKEHAVETAEKIGQLLRMNKVMRGIGTIRQDVNLSIPQGARVEIKGFQNINEMQQVIFNEIERQKNYAGIISELKKRFNNKIEYPFEIYDVTDIFECAKSNLFSNLKKGWKVIALKMPNFHGLFGMELMKGYRFGTELSGYAKPAGVRGIIHSDENFEKYKLEQETIDELQVTLDFPFVMVIAPEDVAFNALKRVYERSKLLEVPGETRNVDGLNSVYMRPLPGSARMYPETDILPIKIDKLWVKVKTPETYDKRLARLEKVMGKDLAEKIVIHPKFYLIEKFKDPKLATWVITDLLKSVSRDGFEVTDDLIEQLLTAYEKGMIVRAAFEPVLKTAIKDNITIKQAVDNLDIKKFNKTELKKIVTETGKMQEIMKKYRLRVDPKDVMDLLKK